MNYSIKNMILLSFLIQSSTSLLHAQDNGVMHVTQQRIDEHEKAIESMMYQRQVQRYALYAALTGGTIYTLYQFFGSHEVSFLPNFHNKQYVTQEELHESQKQLRASFIENYGLTQKIPVVQADEKKRVAFLDACWGFAGTIKNYSVSFAQFGLASFLLTKAQGIFFSNESIGWFYTTEQSIAAKAQNFINWAGVFDADMRPDCPRTQSAKDLNKQFFIECAHDYIDSLMALVGFMQYKAKSLQVFPETSGNASFTCLREAVTLYATELALKVESRIIGDTTSVLQDEVRKTDRLVESLYKKFLMLEKKYS